MPDYETRYCAFVDISASASLIISSIGNQISADVLQSLLTKVHNPPETNAGSLEKAEFRAQSISDAVALSGAVNLVGLAAIMHAINRLAVDLLAQGFFIRGAIVKDRLHHDDQMVFGRGLVRAYQLETNIADYPRVMITRDVVDDFRSYDHENKSFHAFLSARLSGRWTHVSGRSSCDRDGRCCHLRSVRTNHVFASMTISSTASSNAVR